MLDWPVEVNREKQDAVDSGCERKGGGEEDNKYFCTPSLPSLRISHQCDL
jgi:hypothetical protein